MPFKGNENMLEDYSNRVAIGQDEEDDEVPKRRVEPPVAPPKTEIDDIFGLIGENPRPTQPVSQPVSTPAYNPLEDIFGTTPITNPVAT